MSVRQVKFGVLAAVLAASLSATPALAESDGDATAGKAFFNKNCRVCHQAEKEKNGAGPYLVGIVGREAASVEGFKRYSKPMKASGIVWDSEQITAFITAPRKFLKGTTMGFRGFKKEADIAAIPDLIAYLTDPSAAQ